MEVGYAAPILPPWVFRLTKVLQQFLDCPMTGNWARFDAYAHRIRSITFDDDSPWGGKKNRAVTFKTLGELSLYHPRGAFFPPNVRELSWAGQLCDSALSVLPFISKSLENFHLDLGEDVQENTAQKLIHSILQRQTNLKSFSFESSFPPDKISEYLAQLISNSPELESITLPRYYQTQAIADTLCHLRKLKSLQVSHRWDQPHNPRGQALNFLPGLFLGLHTVEIDAPIQEITRILTEFRPALRPRNLTISCAHLNNAADVAALTPVVAQCCPALQALSFNFCRSTSASTTVDTVDLAFTIFQPVFACRDLRTFRIGFRKPITVTEHDLEGIARAWPSLQVLALAPESQRQAAGALSWNMLPLLAKIFPNLEELSTAFSSIDSVSFAGDIFPQAQFQSLKKLGVGMSAAPNDHAALGFLIGAHCRLPTSISCEPSVWEQRWQESSGYARWRDVENVARRVQQTKEEILTFADLPPELLLAVFSYAEQRELAAAARVCQKWSTLALDALWKDLDSVVPLVELVIPLIHAGDKQAKWSWSLAQKPTESQWHRYDAYASRVRTIKFQDQSYARRQRNRAITVKLINALVSLHPRGAFCPPRLRKLEWSSVRAESALAVVPFLCDTLEDLDLGLHMGPKVEKGIIKQAAGRTPRLKSLYLSVSDGLESSVVLWLSKLQLLESLSLPIDYQTRAMMRAI
ncbi:hypothetical protein FRC01_006107, partial [Tulasnella sp. 417]